MCGEFTTTLTLTDCDFYDNTSTDGLGGGLYANADDGTNASISEKYSWI